MKRESHLFACHKFLEELGSQILLCLAKVDFRNTSEIENLYNQLEEYVATLINHALWEEEFIFNAFFTKDEVSLLLGEHSELCDSSAKIMETLKALLDLPPQSREYEGKQLYLEFRKFYAANLMHFYEEETTFLSLLQERATDEEMRAIDKPIYKSMSDHDIVEMLEKLLPPTNISDKKQILNDLKSCNALHFEKALPKILKILTSNEALEVLEQTLSTILTFEDYEKSKASIEDALVQAIIHKHQLPDASLMLFSDGTNIVFSYADTKVIKIFPPVHQNQFESERLVLKHLHGKLSIKTPKLEHEGELFGWPYLIMSKLEGTNLETLWETMPHTNKAIILRELGALIREVHAIPTDGLLTIDCHWEQFLEKQMANCVKQHQEKGLPAALLEQIPDYLESIKEKLPKIKMPVILTGEYTPMNFLVNQIDDVWHINGLIDFGDAMLGLPEYDLLGPGAFLIQGDKQLLREFLTSYGYLSHEMTDILSHQLMALMLLHQYSNLNIQVRIPNWKDRVHSLKDLEWLVWGF